MSSKPVFEASPKQTEFIEKVVAGKHRIVAYGGAIRGGKTYAGLFALILLSKMYPGSRWIVVRDSLMNLKLTTIPSFQKLCPVNFLSKFNQDTMTATFNNGSQILFFGEQYETDKSLDRFRGLECNGFLMEECSELQEQTFYKCIERAGTHIPAEGKKPPPLILLTCNPTKKWPKALIYDRWKVESLPDDWCYIPSRIFDNPSFANDELYMESLKMMPTYEYNVFVLGDWEMQAKAKDAAYKTFDPDVHAAVEYEYDPNAPLYLSIDENVQPFFTCIAFQVVQLEEADTFEVRIIAELLARDPFNTVSGLTEMIKKRFPPEKHKSTVELFGDATSRKADVKQEKGANLFTILRGHLEGYIVHDRVGKSNENVAARISWINSVMEKETNGLRFRIDARCKHTISEFMLTKQAEDQTKLKEMVTGPNKIRYQAQGHISDAVDYFLTGLFKEKYLKYKTQGGSVASRISTGRTPSKNNDYGHGNQSSWNESKNKWRY